VPETVVYILKLLSRDAIRLQKTIENRVTYLPWDYVSLTSILIKQAVLKSHHINIFYLKVKLVKKMTVKVFTSSH